MTQEEYNALTELMETAIHKLGGTVSITATELPNKDIYFVVLSDNKHSWTLTVTHELNAYPTKSWIHAVDQIMERMDMRVHTCAVMQVVLDFFNKTPAERLVQYRRTPFQVIPFSSIILTAFFTSLVTIVGTGYFFKDIINLILNG